MNNVSPLFGLLEWLLTVLGAKCKLLTRIIHGNPVGCGLCLAPLRCHRPCFPCHSVPASIPASTALTTPRCFLALATSWPWKAPFGSLHCWLLHVPSSDASLTSASVARPSHPSRSKYGSPLFILTALCFSRCPSMVCNYLFIILLIGLLTCWQPIYPIRAKNMFIVFTVVFITLTASCPTEVVLEARWPTGPRADQRGPHAPQVQRRQGSKRVLKMTLDPRKRENLCARVCACVCVCVGQRDKRTCNFARYSNFPL